MTLISKNIKEHAHRVVRIKEEIKKNPNKFTEDIKFMINKYEKFAPYKLSVGIKPYEVKLNYVGCKDQNVARWLC